jgi:Protein of unknown function (DUF3071)
MRPVRFVALSEDGHALVLADEVGRLLTLPIDDRVSAMLKPERSAAGNLGTGAESTSTLSPRDIQARIRAGESADDVARIAGVPVDRVLRYAGPVLQERAMLAQHARRTKLKSQEKGKTLAEVVDSRLGQHGIDAEKISWDAYRRDDGTWRIVATWPSGKATAQAVWELDKTRQLVAAHDDMAQYLCAERPTQILGQDPPTERLRPPPRSEPGRGGHEPMRPPAAEPARRESRGGRGLADPIRAGRDALLASLDKPLGVPGAASAPGAAATSETPTAPTAPAASAEPAARARGAAALIGRGPGYDDDLDGPKDIPAVPSLAVLRPRRSSTVTEQPGTDKPRKRLPSWDDVLFGGTPAARETS